MQFATNSARQIGRQTGSLLLSSRARMMQRIGGILGNGLLLSVTSFSMLAVLFIFIYIARDAWPFFRSDHLLEFFTSTRWYPSAAEAEFGALAIIFGSVLVTLGAVIVAVPLGVVAAICLSDILPFALRQFVKPVIEMLAAIPSVAYGFFALVVFAPLLQEQDGRILAVVTWVIGLPLAALAVIVAGDVAGDRFGGRHGAAVRWIVIFGLGVFALAGLALAGRELSVLRIASGTNALNVSLILGIMALPTIVSVSEDALQAAGRELREGSYALGATRAETLLKVILPAAASGILAAVILGVMRAIGETMVVWMASGNASRIPEPWFNFLDPVRTLTATIAGDMGEADHVTGSTRYHVLFAMAFCLLVFSFVCNLVSEWFIRKSAGKQGG